MLLAVATAVALFVVIRGKGASQQPPSPVPNRQQTALPTNTQTSGTSLVAQVGAVLTGAAGGAELGKQIDIILGGDGKGETAIVAQLGGAAVGAIAVLAAMGVVGWAVFGIALGVVAVVYAIASAISDINRLQYGQLGAIRDYNAQWTEVYNKAFASMRANEKFAMKNDSEIEFVATAVTDGYMMRLNRIAYESWMRRPKGFAGTGLSDKEHMLWGRDRGYFISNENADGALTFPDSLVRTKRLEFASKFGRLESYEQAEQRTRTIQKAREFLRMKYDDLEYEPIYDTVTETYVEMVVVQRPILDGSALTETLNNVSIGDGLCNIGQYVNFMKSTIDIGDESARNLKGLREGYYEGMAEGPYLVYRGAKMYWKELQTL